MAIPSLELNSEPEAESFLGCAISIDFIMKLQNERYNKGRILYKLKNCIKLNLMIVRLTKINNSILCDCFIIFFQTYKNESRHIIR